jgi:formylglycine-generating enzyme required for sulfatase activity
MRSIRAGSWYFNPDYARATYRCYYDPSKRYYDIGFRCVRGGSPEDQKIRGGAWYYDPPPARPTYRSYDDPDGDGGGDYIGFRCARRIA